MILAEINYHIYDKKLLVIIWCFEHWRLKLKCTELLIQMFIDHQTLKIFMKNKQLSQQQVNYLNILLKFNFQIIFRSDKTNTKVNALIRMFLVNVSESAQRLKIIFRLFWSLIKLMFYLLNWKKISINEYVWSIKQMSSAANINKLWTTTSLNFISLNWRTAKSLTTFYLEKIYCESLRTCTRNYYKKCMINLQSLTSTINKSSI